jgi:replicative DNA helicase
MTQVQLMMKIVSSETDIPLWKVERNQLTESENERWYKALAKAGDKNMTIIDKGGISAEDIVVKARQLHGEKELILNEQDSHHLINFMPSNSL